MLRRIINGTFIVWLGISLWAVMGLRRAYPKLAARLQRGLVGLHLRLYKRTGGAVGGRIPTSGPILVLTTTGRRTGRLHRTPLLYLPDGEDMVIVASNGGDVPHPAWYLNLRDEPQAQAEVPKERANGASQKFSVVAEEVGGEDKRLLWQRLIRMYPLYGNYQRRTDREIPVVRLRSQ